VLRCEFIFGGLMLALLSGCASNQQPAPRAANDVSCSNEFDHAVTASSTSSSSALLFDPPMYAADVPIDLSRAGREASAFVAYEDQTTTFSYIRIDDRQSIPDFGKGRYERRAITERFGSSTR
jgi:hypothetical protein